MKQYDAIVVGAGAGGGIVAGVLAEAGKRVLLLERGRWLKEGDIPYDHLRNHRLALYGHGTGPDLEGNPRVAVDTNGVSRIVRPHEGGYQNNAMTVGGGTRIYGGQAWRFMPQDFRMASLYGVPEGSSLSDWPLAYEDLEPYYERAEWEIGVAGDGEGNRFQGPRRKDYPLPPTPDTLTRTALKGGAEALGWSTFPVPILINTAPYQGRPACIQCKYCVGFNCPSNSKNGTHVTLIPRAIATGNCDLLTQAIAERIETDGQGNAIGVTYLTEAGGAIARETAQAQAIIVSGGAIESARLLLNSRSDRHPQGIGNQNDQVGRNLQGHYYSGAIGHTDESVFTGLGPGPSIATCQFNHGNPGVIGGGMLADEFVKLPIIYWKNSLPPDVPRWGQANKDWMRSQYRRCLHVMGPVQDIPSPEARVQTDPAVRDKYGLPVARLSGTTHPETVRTAEFMRQRAIEWLMASGANGVFSYPHGLGLSGGQHQAGTCRMGDDPKTSVTDKWGRVHGQDRLFVADGSLHVTNGGFNPVLTIMALAFRAAEHIATQVL
jgi:choline dehydrogenase-like flavoprotein